jgi:hypothetical protein
LLLIIGIMANTHFIFLEVWNDEEHPFLNVHLEFFQVGTLFSVVAGILP